jgi:hypothetical protein
MELPFSFLEAGLRCRHGCYQQQLVVYSYGKFFAEPIPTI